MDTSQTDAGFACPGKLDAHGFGLGLKSCGFQLVTMPVHTHSKEIQACGSRSGPLLREETVARPPTAERDCKELLVSKTYGKAGGTSDDGRAHHGSTRTPGRLTSATRPAQAHFPKNALDPRWLCDPRSHGVCLYRLTFKEGGTSEWILLLNPVLSCRT
jgi:hypothetical protein